MEYVSYEKDPLDEDLEAVFGFIVNKVLFLLKWFPILQL